MISLGAGSAVAFGKLHGLLASKPLSLPGKDVLNIGALVSSAFTACICNGRRHGVHTRCTDESRHQHVGSPAGMAAGSVAAGAAFLTTGDASTGLAALGATTAFGGAMGAHMTASIGGADMPVVITLLNSYSGCISS